MTETPGRATAAARLDRSAEGLALACLVLAPWPYGSAADGPRFALAAVLLLAGTLGMLATALRGEGLPPLALPAAAGLSFGGLQLILGWSAAPVWTAEALLVLAAMLGIVLFWSDRAADRSAPARLASAVLVGCSAQALFGAVQWSIAPQRIYGRETPIVTTPFGSYVNHNHFAGLLEMGAVLALGMALGEVRRSGGLTPRSVVFAGTSLGLGAAHLASRSRGGLLAFVGGLALLGLAWAASRARSAGSGVRWGAAGAAAVCVLGFGLAVVPGSARRHLASVLAGPADTSGEYRVDIARATLALTRAHPLRGVGLGAYADAVPAFKAAHGEVRTTHAESDALEFPAECGLIGVGLALWLGRRVLRGFADRLQRGRDPFRKGIAVGAAAAVGAMLVHALADFNLHVPANALVFASLLGLAATPRSETRRAGGARAAAAAAAVLIVLAVAAAWRSAGAWALVRALERPERQIRIARLDAVLARHPYLADGYRARAAAEWDLARGAGTPGGARLTRAEADLRRALALRPAWGEAWADLAWMLALRGDAGGARETMGRAAQLDPTHPGLRRSREALDAWLARPGLSGGAQ